MSRLNSIPYFSWKGRTFNNITTTIQQNVNTGKHDIFKALPMQIYRKELTLNPIVHSRRVSIDELDYSIPSVSKCTLAVVDANYTDSTCTSMCNISEVNALKRVRSAGMISKRTDISKKYYTNSSNYLNSRSKSFNQNQFHYLKTGDATAQPGSTAALQNTYSANSVSHVLSCSNKSTVYYKPSNANYAKQGAVSASDLITRVKYNTITDNTVAYRRAYGTEVANALAYEMHDGYTIKDKIGVPSRMTPKFTPTGVKNCISTSMNKPRG